MKLRLISFPICPYVHRSRILLDTKGADYDTDYVDLDNKPGWFLERVPTGKVPALFVRDSTLFESNVINEYLDDTNEPRVYPQEPIERAREKAWIVFTDSLLISLYRSLKAESSAEYERQKQELMDGIARVVDFVADRAAIGPNLGGFEVAIAPLLFRIEHVPDLRAAFWTRFDDSGAFSRWARFLIDHPAVRNSVPRDFNEQFIDFFELSEQGDSPCSQPAWNFAS